MNKIFILLSTYNGARYLKAQLDSLFAQTYCSIEIIARDDDSNDETISILKSYNIKILDTKENLGAKESFAELLNYAVVNSTSDYFMFCDQDDVWEKDKIEKNLFTEDPLISDDGKEAFIPKSIKRYTAINFLKLKEYYDK